MSECLQRRIVVIVIPAFDEASGDIDHPSTGMHQAVANTGDTVGVAAAAGCLGIGQIPGKGLHPEMRRRGRIRLGIARVTDRAAGFPEGVRRTEPLAHGGVTVEAGIGRLSGCWSHQGCSGDSYQEGKSA